MHRLDLFRGQPALRVGAVHTGPQEQRERGELNRQAQRTPASANRGETHAPAC